MKMLYYGYEGCDFVRINWIEFKNLTTHQEIQHIEFANLNLLVGVSGAGKTQILKTISKFVDFALRIKPIINFEADFSMGFTASNVVDDNSITSEKNDSQDYTWKIKFRKDKKVDANFSNIAIIEEYLDIGTKNIFKRNQKELTIDGYDAIPQIDGAQSVISIFRNNHVFNNILANFTFLSSYYQQQIALNPLPVKIYENMDTDFLEETSNIMLSLITSQIPIAAKLLFAKKFNIQEYHNIIEKFTAVFPSVIDLKVDLSPARNHYEFYIRTEQSGWIRQQDISGGMLKALFILATIEFSISQNSVILIDEFENGLGANCIDGITDYLNDVSTDVQLIITSHHPYIINHIQPDCWKLISQKNGIISNRDAKTAGIGISKQDAFYQLLNLWEFENEI